MKRLVKFLTISLTAMIALSTFAFGQLTVVARPNQVPAGAYVNGADGDHQFFQSLEITMDGAVLATTEWAITMPAGITVADVDDDGLFDDVYINYQQVGALTTIGFKAASGSASGFTLEVTAVGAMTTGDKVTVLIPVESSTTPAAGLTYTVTPDALTVAQSAGTSNAVAIVASVTLLDTYFDDVYLNDAGVGKMQTDVRGKYYPDTDVAGGLTYTDALPDLLVDLIAGNTNTVTSDNDWLPGILSYENTANNDGEVTFQLWASMTDGLKRVGPGTGELLLDASTDAAFAAANEAAAITSQVIATYGVMHTAVLDEGNWFAYITADASGDWVLGSSDTLEVRHHPAFIDPSVAGAPVATGALIGAGDGIDYDHDGAFEPKLAVGSVGITDGDDATATTLESGGTIGRDGLLVDLATTTPPDYDNPAFDSVNVHWTIEDVDDNARIHVFTSTNSGFTVADVTTAAGVVTGLGTATEITTTAQYEEDPTNFATWKIYTDATTFETAGDYFIYIVAYDGTNLGFRKVTNSTGVTTLTVTVKHFPFFQFYDRFSDADDAQTFDTATDQYLMLNWGGTIDGDKDADAAGTAVIKLYWVDEAAGANDYAAIAGVNPTLAGALTNLQAVGTLITTITDVSDTQENNRYMFDVRAAGIADATVISFWAHINHGSDNLIVQMNGATNPIIPGADEDDRSFTIANGAYLRPVTPYAGPPVELDGSDMFRMSWEAFDLTAGGTEEVQVLLVEEGSADNLGNATWATWNAIVAGNDIIWVVPGVGGAGGDNQVAADGAPAADGGAVVDMSNITVGVGGAAFDAGNYDVYYFFNDVGAFGAHNAVKAPGQVYLTGQATNAYDIRLSPNKAHIAPGDILDVDIVLTDAGVAIDKALFTVLIPQSSLFTPVDQDASTAGIQPFDNDLGVTVLPAVNDLRGEVLMNTAGVNADGEWALGYMQDGDGLGAAMTDENMVSFQIEMTGVISDPLEDIEITFGLNDPYETKLVTAAGAQQAVSIPLTAMALKLGQAGKLSGVVDVEGRVDKDEVVDFFVVPAGSVDPITTASFLSANSDIDGSDGVQITLDGGGYYELLGVPTGEYDIIVHKTRYANSIRENVRVTSLGDHVENFVGARKLLGGDAAGYVDTTGTNVPNNRIDATDTNAITAALIGSVPTDTTWNTYADINENSIIDVNDLFMAGKNIGTDGGGAWYKDVPGTNDEAIVWMVLDDESSGTRTYTVKAKHLTSLGAYSAELNISESDWEVMEVSDGFSRYTNSVPARGDGIFASAVLGHSDIRNAEMDLVTFTMRSRGSNTVEPALAEVSLVDANGNLTRGIISTEADVTPKAFSLSRNYPNPFNPSTTINFSLPEQGNVKLSVFNLLGQEVKTLVSSDMEPGTYKAVWNAQNNMGQKVSSGIYFYRLTVNNKVINTYKMLMLK
jgi:hypothetical protein